MKEYRCPNCIECVCEGEKLKDHGEWHTDWYGKMAWFKCSCCKEIFVSVNGKELESSS